MLLLIRLTVYFFVALSALISFFRAMQYRHFYITNAKRRPNPFKKGVIICSVKRGFMTLCTASLLLCLGGVFGAMPIKQAVAQEAKIVVKGSGLPVPRFVTLKSDEVNMRVGPGREYPLSWVYKQKNLPLKVIAEFDTWRKVIDHEGTIGWVHSQLVGLKRYALIQSRLTKLHRKPDSTSPVLAVADKGVLLELQICEPQWCRVASDSVRAYVRRDDIWGVLETETLN